MNSVKHYGIAQSAKSYGATMNSKAMGLVYNNQANIHNNMLMRQQQQLQQLMAFQQQMMARNPVGSSGSAQHQQESIAPQIDPRIPNSASQFITFSGNPGNAVKQEDPPNNYEYDIGCIKNTGSNRRIPTINEDAEGTESPDDKKHDE